MGNERITEMHEKKGKYVYKKTKGKSFNLALANRYKNYCNIVNFLLKETRRRFFENEFNRFKNNPKMQ